MNDLASANVLKAIEYVVNVENAGYSEITVSNVCEFYEGRKKSVPSFIAVQALVSAFSGQSEPITDYFERLGWVEISDNTVSSTKLGKAIVRSARSDRREISESSFISFNANDDEIISYAKFIEKVAEIGGYMICDPYLRVEDLPSLLKHTKVSRILTSSKIDNRRGEIAGLDTLLQTIVKEGRNLAIRISPKEEKQFHDRLIIPDSGNVMSVGTSVNSIHKNVSAMIEFPEIASDQFRKVYEEFWDNADPVQDVC